tara:strand:+ start:40 stop:1566 length:1527 start_codon:yes stop_codon:yes gene_type:complete
MLYSTYFGAQMKTAIQPTRTENYPEWYLQVIQAADLAETAPVRGCMVIKPYGYAIWEAMKKHLDTQIKASGHENMYCPMFIPLAFLEKEAEHVAGFAKECAVVTHSKLVQNDEGKLVPSGKLDEPLVVRPTSETMIGALFAKWIQSYRDLPLLTNQWANIVRWEMRTRLFLRTTEFLWQEGHTAHASADEAKDHTIRMLNMYIVFSEDVLAIPVISGNKSENERFPGAVNTYTLEALMQDNKALQLGTSHFLGQNFAKGSNITYQDEHGKSQYVYTTSWGVTTRMIGALIMSHADDDGLIVPPRVAPYHLVIIPLFNKKSDPDKLIAYCKMIQESLHATSYHGESLRVHVDTRTCSGGEKNWSWVKKGVPIRVEIGARELAEESATFTLRTKAYRDRQTTSLQDFIQTVIPELDLVQQTLLQRAKDRLDRAIVLCKSADEVAQVFSKGSGAACIYWHEDAEVEQMLAERYKASIRCLLDTSINGWELSAPATFTPSMQGQLAFIAKAY